MDMDANCGCKQKHFEEWNIASRGVSQMSNREYVEVEFDPSDRCFNTGYKMKAGKTYFICPVGTWRDFYIKTDGYGWMLPDWLTALPVFLYEKIFSRRRFFPGERLGTLLYLIGDTNIKGAIGGGDFITVPEEYNDEEDKILYLFVNDYNSRFHMENNFGKMTIKIYEF